MTIYQLMNRYREHNPRGHYFDRDSLKWFGERMSEMRVLKGVATVIDTYGKEHTCYVVSSIQHKHPCGPTRHYAYFDTVTYDHIVN